MNLLVHLYAPPFILSKLNRESIFGVVSYVFAGQVYWKTILDEMSISFSVPPQCILSENTSRDSSLANPGGQWLPGAYVNPAKTCLTLNCKRTLDDVVIRWRDEGNDDMPVSSLTLEELRSEVWYAGFHIQVLFITSCFICWLKIFIAIIWMH